MRRVHLRIFHSACTSTLIAFRCASTHKSRLVQQIEEAFPEVSVRRSALSSEPHYSRYIAESWPTALGLFNALNEESLVYPLDAQDDYRDALRLLIRRCYVPSKGPSWQLSVKLFVASLGASEPQSNSPSLVSTRRSFELALGEYYTPSSCTHLMRNLSLAADGCNWESVLRLYQASQVVFPLPTIAQSLPPTAPASHGCFRGMRQIALTSLLYAGKWASALDAFRHIFHSKDFPNNVCSGFLMASLGRRGRWEEASNVLQLVVRMVASGHRQAEYYSRWNDSFCVGACAIASCVRQGVADRSVFENAVQMLVREVPNVFRANAALTRALAEFPLARGDSSNSAVVVLPATSYDYPSAIRALAFRKDGPAAIDMWKKSKQVPDSIPQRDVAELRRYVLNAATPNTNEVLSLYGALNAVAPSSSSMLPREYEIIALLLGKEHSATDCWREALDILRLLPQAATARSISLTLRIGGFPWELALKLLRESKPLLLSADADASLNSSTSDTETSRKFTKQPPGGYYVSSLGNLAECAMRQHNHQLAGKLLETIVRKYRQSPSSFLLSKTPAHVIDPILHDAGEVVDDVVLYHTISASDRRIDRFDSWSRALEVANICLRRKARSIPERSSESILTRISSSVLIAAIRRVAYGPSWDTPSPTQKSLVAMRLLKWLINAQPGMIQKANRCLRPSTSSTPDSSGERRSSKASEDLLMVTIEVCRVCIDCCDSSDLFTSEEVRRELLGHAATSVDMLQKLLVFHKIDFAFHVLSPKTLELIMPATVFDYCGSPAVLYRLQCLQMLLRALLLRGKRDLLTSQCSDIRRALPAAYHVIQYASRGQRLLTKYEEVSLDVVHFPAGESLWELAFEAFEMGRGNKAAGVLQLPPMTLGLLLKALPDYKPTSNSGAASCSSLAAVMAIQAFDEALPDINTTAADEIFSVRTVETAFKKASWCSCVQLLAKYQPGAVMREVQNHNPLVAIQLMEKLES